MAGAATMCKDRIHVRLKGAVATEDAAKTGRRWEVVVIRAGMSKNGVDWPPEVLRDNVDKIIGAPIYEFAFAGSGGERKDHIDELPGDSLQSKAAMTGNKVGEIESAEWNPTTRAVEGIARVDDEDTRGRLLSQMQAVEEGTSTTMDGLSVDMGTIRDQEEPDRVVGIAGVTVDIVTFPAAGGQFKRVIEAVTFVDDPWDGSKSRFTVEQLMAAVPKAVLAEAKRVAKSEDRDVTKDDLRLPFREPNGDVNINAVRNALAVLGGARGGVELPQAVKDDAQTELQEMLDTFNAKRSTEAIVVDETGRTEYVDVAPIKTDKGLIVTDDYSGPLRAALGLVKSAIDMAQDGELRGLLLQAAGLLATTCWVPEAELTVEPTRVMESDMKAKEQETSTAVAETAAPTKAAETPSAPVPAITAKAGDDDRTRALESEIAKRTAESELAAERTEHARTKEALERATSELATLKGSYRLASIQRAIESACAAEDVHDKAVVTLLVDMEALGYDESTHQVTGAKEAVQSVLETRPWMRRAKESVEPAPAASEPAAPAAAPAKASPDAAQSVRVTESIKSEGAFDYDAEIRKHAERARATQGGDLNALLEMRRAENRHRAMRS